MKSLHADQRTFSTSSGPVVIVSYPRFLRELSGRFDYRPYDVVGPIFETALGIINAYGPIRNFEVNGFLERLEETLYYEYEGYMIDIEKETEWFTIMEIIETDDFIPDILRWVNSFYESLPRRGMFSINPFNKTSFYICYD